MSEIIKGINATLQGFYKLAIVDSKTKEVVWEQPNWEKNLILNSGMDEIYNRSIVDCMTYAAAGTGVRPNSYAGGVSTITQSGNEVFMYGRLGSVNDFTQSMLPDYATLVQVGDTIKYANGSQSIVSAIYPTDGYKLQVTTSYTIPDTDAQTFTIWKTSQVDLDNEILNPARTTTYYAGAASRCGTSVASNVKTHRRTYDFTAEPAGGHTYTELGISWGAASNLFSRIIPTSGIFVDETYQLRMIYDLQVTYTPATPVTKQIAIGGWSSQTGSECIQKFMTSTVVTATGASDNSTAILDPYFTTDGTRYAAIWAGWDSRSLEAFDSAVDRSAKSGRSTATMTNAGQTLGYFVLDKTGVIPIGQANYTNIKSIGYGRYYAGVHPSDSSNQILTTILEESNAKNSTETLTLVYRFTWARTLA